ncbi:hypothetical protein ACPCTG_31970 [Streptomyces pseudogriseolus]|uniref:hypothetical protein n=1 Tax=Streptomyces pseudogriseolus TaxID=36817 RepID=UPI003FA266D3
MARDFASELGRLSNEIKDIKRGQRYAHGGSIENAALEVKDDTGTVRAVIGVQPDGTVGLVAYDGPAPGAPTAPQVTATIGGLRVVWDGALADGSTLPADFDHVAVHVSTSSGFTPSAETFAGTITKAGDGGMLPVLPLPYEAHYVRLTAVNTSGNASGPSEETEATPIKVDGPDLEAGSVTAAAIQAGAVTAEKLEAVLQLVTRLVAGDPAGARVELNEDGLRVYNTAGDLTIRFDAADGSAVFTGTITGSTVTGGLIRTATSGQRITMNEAGQNKILVYNSSGTAIGELSVQGLLVAGTNGAILALDPNNTFPSLRLTNASRSNEAVINVSGSNAVLGLNSGTFPAGGQTWKWRTLYGLEGSLDFWAAERVRNDNNTLFEGGRIYLDNVGAVFGYRNSADSTQDATVRFSPGLARFSQARTEMHPAASNLSALYVNAADGHTGNLLRLMLNAVEKFRVDKDGNAFSNNRPVPVPGAWASLTESAWSTTPSSTSYQSIRIQSDGTRAYLDGAASTKTGFTGSQNAFTIPAGMRPVKNHFYGLVRATSGDPRFLGCLVQSSGTITVYASTAVTTTDTFDFSDISWPLD